MDFYLTISAIMKNEGPYLKEWLEFHHMVGVEHFFLYDNNSDDKTREILELVGLAQVLHPGIPVVIITGNPDGPLALQSNMVLYTGDPEEVCPLGLTPTTSATVMAVIGDVLVVLLMKRIGFTSSDYAKRHHGGYLGQKSRESDYEN